ncbi:unnamed protein product [Auanema sp. JU1783]|nr:unnamed protein product [Auanema sp. JU1783]
MAFNNKERDFAAEKDRIREFFQSHYEENSDGAKVFSYRDQITRIAEREEVSFPINMDDVYNFDPSLAESFHGNARRYMQLVNEVLDELIQDYLGERQPPVRDALDAFIFQRLYMDNTQKNIDGGVISSNDARKKYPPQLLRRYELSLKSKNDDKVLAVRDIKASSVGKLVSVGGIVIRATEVRPMASVITYSCDTCGAEAYQPVNGPSFTPALSCPSKDCTESKANGRLHMQIRGSKFVKFQELKIQELSEQVPVGSIPRSLTINVYGENTRKCIPGDNVKITGVFVPLLQNGYRVGGGLVAETYLEAYHVENQNRTEDENLELTDELTDEEIEMVSQDNFYDLLAYSIAPEIYGLKDVKKSLLLALVGGVDKNASGMKIRGALNILLMGDPGVAKSQLLSYIDRLAPRSQYTTGRGSSGVGLTAAVMKDPLTGEMTLEGGALVLADKGICCIDEFDKMLDSDRTAIHEVMEQQSISIAKAGIMTTLNARVSIIAAANPAFGRYNPQRSIEQNINLPAALLSRFDLLWLIRDKADRECDKRLAMHILHVHKFGKQPEITGLKPLEMSLVRRYVTICKKKNPVVDESLRERLVEMYVDMRREARDSDDSTFTSPRMLLSVIRMSTALARLRLMQTSKDSLRPEIHRQEMKQSPIDQAFSVLREIYHSQGNDEPIIMQTAVQKCARKGISEETLQKSIETYCKTGILLLDRQQRIRFSIN